MSQKIMLHNVRLSYEHVFEPTAFDDKSEKKFSGTFIIPKDHNDAKAIKQAFVAAGAEKWAQQFQIGKAWPQGYTCALKDADKETNDNGELLAEKNPEYKGCYVLRADSARRPLVIDRQKRAVAQDDGVIYSGCYVNVSIGIGPYEYGKVKKGIKAYLNGVQFVKDGERFGSDSLSDFDALDGADDDDADGWM